jgi:UDP-N-acetylmuramoylalanine--D-glutamate ligase
VSGLFSSERVVVVGAGVAGTAAARVLTGQGARVVVTEARSNSELGAGRAAELSELGAELHAGGHREEDLAGATLVVVSPGVAPSSPVFEWAAARGIPVWGELELGARLARAPYIAVTGTNGKSTTTAMIEACLRAEGFDAVACGNIGHSFPLAANGTAEVLVVECSSFQLELQESFHPKVSVLLNVAEDHLDWHGSLAAYRAAKLKVFRLQGPADVHVGNRDDSGGAAASAEAACPTIWITREEPGPGEMGFVGDRLVSHLGDDPVDIGDQIPDGPGYREDAAAAAAAALSFGARASAVRDGLGSFRPLRHRGETVAELDGVRFMDNSKATNVHAALAALAHVEDVVLIAGGLAKGADVSRLATRADRIRAAVAMGEAAPDVVRALEGVVEVKVASSIEEATRVAFELAARPGTVLLAPACASWDQFRDYAERGKRFAEAARALGGQVAARG